MGLGLKHELSSATAPIDKQENRRERGSSRIGYSVLLHVPKADHQCLEDIAPYIRHNFLKLRNDTTTIEFIEAYVFPLSCIDPCLRVPLASVSWSSRPGLCWAKNVQRKTGSTVGGGYQSTIKDILCFFQRDTYSYKVWVRWWYCCFFYKLPPKATALFEWLRKQRGFL